MVELVVSMALMTMLMAALLPFGRGSVRNYQLASSQITLEQQAAYALYLLTRDLRTATPGTVIIGSGTDNITFTSHAHGVERSITYERGSLPILYRNLNNNAGAQPVTSLTHSALNKLSFSYHHGDTRVIDIILTVEDMVSQQLLTLTTSVYLEN